MKITRYIITCKKCIKLIMIIIYWLIINTKGITNIKDIKIVQKRVQYEKILNFNEKSNMFI